MIHFRTFRNADPPGLVEVWNESCLGRGSAYLTANLLFEYFLLSKPYFDPAGLIVALDEERIIGFGLAGFGPAAAGDALDLQKGVTCALAVLPDYQRRAVGTELLGRCETYLRGRGAAELYAGPQGPLNPYTFAIYGGSDSPGFLDSDRAIGGFLQKHGYRPERECLVLQRAVATPLVVPDPRFAGLRSRYEIFAGPRRGSTWWQEATLGPVELHEFRLTEKASNQVHARLSIWEMEPYRPRWNEHAIGVAELLVLPERRRQGLGKFLLAQVLRHLQEQYFTLAEVQLAPDNAGGLALLRSLNFGQADADVSIGDNEVNHMPSGPLVGVIMGSRSDWETMAHAVQTLEKLRVSHEVRVVSAHRTPDLLFEYAAAAEARGLEVLIAGAGGAAHLPGMTAAKTVLPVLGVPVESTVLRGVDSLLSIVQMPGGIPVGTLALGKAGAINAALLAAAILGIKYREMREELRSFRAAQTQAVLEQPDPRADP